jgi:hypothetical protein
MCSTDPQLDLEIGTLVEIDLEVGPVSQHVLARVARRTQGPAGAQEYGMDFQDLTSAARASISDYVDRLLVDVDDAKVG